MASVSEESATTRKVGGMKKIERLPRLKQAIVLNELLGKPRGLQGF